MSKSIYTAMALLVAIAIIAMTLIVGVALADDATPPPAESVTFVTPDASPDGQVLDDITDALLVHIAVAIPLITTLVAIVKYLAPSVSPVLVRLALSSVAYVLIVHIQLEVPFEGVTSLLVAVAGIFGLDVGANEAYKASQRAEMPLLGDKRTEPPLG